MKTIAAHTLGCKVNQYDTQAMLELFCRKGFRVVPVHQEADVYLVNTCTVTGVGDKKSIQLIRKLHREHPQSRLIVCGCMAQERGKELLSLGADLVLGIQQRSEVVSLLEQVIRTSEPLCAVYPFAIRQPYEMLEISNQADHTRAVLKIQEGCDNHCTYCIIPSVRGPVRSRPPESILEEVHRLTEAGFCEIVLTGIHLCSYGRDLSSSCTLMDVIRMIQEESNVLRIRLGSLEPTIATVSFVSALKQCAKFCPQFHLALQSGSDTVLARMKRRYNTTQYLQAVDRLREAFPQAAFTTDILTGFPGETDREFQETKEMIRRVGYSRIHVFPYSARPNTPAASMPDQLSAALKEQRVRELIKLGHEVAQDYLNTWIGKETELLPEQLSDGCWEGYTPEYIRVRMAPGSECVSGNPVRIRLEKGDSRVMRGYIIK